MRSIALVGLLALTLESVNDSAEPLPMLYPRVAGYGGVVDVVGGVEPPRAAARIVFDTTADSPAAGVNRGLESAARYLNLHAQAGGAPQQVQLTVILHGPATKVALGDEGYARQTAAASNPNLELARKLRACGVELLVCGQSLARHNFAMDEVADCFGVAVSAMTVNANRQASGYAYLAIH